MLVFLFVAVIVRSGLTLPEPDVVGTVGPDRQCSTQLSCQDPRASGVAGISRECPEMERFDEGAFYSYLFAPVIEYVLAVARFDARHRLECKGSKSRQIRKLCFTWHPYGGRLTRAPPSCRKRAPKRAAPISRRAWLTALPRNAGLAVSCCLDQIFKNSIFLEKTPECRGYDCGIVPPVPFWDPERDDRTTTASTFLSNSLPKRRVGRGVGRCIHRSRPHH